jgi:Domain of unknown function (DUF4276)
VKRVLVLVEGQTEETFVKAVLAPHLWGFEKAPEVTRVATKRVQGRRAFRGGIPTYGKVEGDVRRLLGSSPAAVTTLFDYYALPDDFPGKKDLPAGASCYQRAAHIELAFAASIDDARFIPNLVLHEFEGLLFTGPMVIAEVLLERARAADLEGIAAGYASPEEIDEGPETHPSRRIERILPGYEKALHGPQIAARIGIAGIRARCPHFDAWLTRIEGL